MTDYFSGQKIALLTQHGKEKVIAPVLEPALGCIIERVDGYDTDLLGTFTRDVPRPGSQLDAARRKARIGMALANLPRGLASEGSFVLDPHTGMFPWNIELLIFIDDHLGIEILGVAQGPTRRGHLQTGTWSEVESFAMSEGFPAQQLVLRPDNQHDSRLHKGIADWPQLRTEYALCVALANNGQVFVETDLRAFANPPRMQRIGEAASALLQRLQSHCPDCDLPGFALTEHLPGLPCEACQLPTQVHRHEIFECTICRHRLIRTRTDRTHAAPQHCAYCNP